MYNDQQIVVGCFQDTKFRWLLALQEEEREAIPGSVKGAYRHVTHRGLRSATACMEGKEGT